MTASPIIAPQPSEYSIFTKIMNDYGDISERTHANNIAATNPNKEMPMPTKEPYIHAC